MNRRPEARLASGSTAMGRSIRTSESHLPRSTADGSGAPGRNRTCCLMLRRHALYPVSYRRSFELGDRA